MKLKWIDFITTENLVSMANKLSSSCKNKFKSDIIEFYTDFSRNIINLYKSLINGNYQHDNYKFFSFKTDKGKERLIHYSKFKDMIVERLLNKHLTYLYENEFIKDTYSGLKGRGVYHMVLKLKEYQMDAYYNFNNPMLIKLDVKSYFHTINKDLVMDIIRDRTNDDLLLYTLRECMYTDNDTDGLRLGNLTSSIIGNIYLNELDHHIQDTLNIDHMCRYMDDIVLLVDMNRTKCRELYHSLNDLLIKTREVEFNVNKTLIRDINFIPVLGYVLKIVDGKHVIKLTSRNKSKYLKLVKSNEPNLIQHLNSWWGYANIADCNYMIHRSLKNRGIIFDGKFKKKIIL